MPDINAPVSTLLASKPSGVFSIHADQSVSEAVAEMNRHRVGSVLVLDGDRVAGIFTERDVLTRVVAEALDPRATPVSAVMTPDPQRVTTDTSIGDTMGLMTEKRTRHLPVFAADGSLAGMISIGDVTRWQIAESRDEAEHLKNYVFGGT